MVAICAAAIDWAATGTMLQALAACAGVGAVIWAAKQGRDAVADWRAQKQVERQLGAAEQILTAAYRVRSALEMIRSPMMSGAELDKAITALKESGVEIDAMEAGKRSRIQQAQGIYNRVQFAKPDWDKLFEAMPIAAAYFGPELEGHLAELAKQRNMVLIAADMYADEAAMKDADLSKKVRADIWGWGKNPNGGDEIASKVEAAIEALEATLLPILRSNHEAP